MPVTNAEILRKLWIEEVPMSKKRRLTDLIRGALGGISTQAACLRLTGKTDSNDAELVFIIDILKKNGINTDEFNDKIRQIRQKYGVYEYSEYQLQ